MFPHVTALAVIGCKNIIADNAIAIALFISFPSIYFMSSLYTSHISLSIHILFFRQNAKRDALVCVSLVYYSCLLNWV